MMDESSWGGLDEASFPTVYLVISAAQGCYLPIDRLSGNREEEINRLVRRMN
jgi:hypothetical protein